MSQPLSEKITTETLRKIASNEEYDENEILCVAEYLVNLYEYDFGSQFGLINTEDLSKSVALDKLTDLNIKEQPYFVVYSKGIKHWVCLAVTYLHASVVVLYKDSHGAQIPHCLRDAIGDRLKTEQIRFDSHRGTEQNDESSSGPICLRNMQVFLKGLKSDYIKVPLIEKFQKVRFCSQYGVQSVKREFRLWLQNYLLSGLEKVVSELVGDENYGSFQKSLCNFLDSCAKILKESFVLSSNYTSLLKTEAKKKIQDPKYETDHKTVKALKEARDNFYRNSEVQKSLKLNKDDFIDLDNGNRVYNLDIQERYPELMQKFTKIFAVLAQAEMNDELEKALKQVSQMLGLEYDKIKIYFEQHKPARRPDFMRGDFTPPNTVGSLEKSVEAIKKSRAKTTKDTAKSDPVDKKIKSWEQLISELVLNVQPTDDPNEIAEQVKGIRESLPAIQKHYADWSDRSIPDISMYANACKAEEKTFDDDQICEAVAILDRANELATGGHRLRASQILAVLVFLKSAASCRGKLCQIESGEGKTVIVSLLAVIMILQGEKTVDVITSNAVLAQEGVDSRKLFYSMFNVSVATNAADKTYASGSRKCYLADVVYGSISDFQFDYLRDSAEGLGTMAGRQFGHVILDEVDNMLIDNGQHIAKISSPFPGMENLKYTYLKIWDELLLAESELMDDFQEKLNEFSDLKSTKEMAVTEFIKIFDASMIGRLEERIKANMGEVDLRFVPTHCLRYAESMVPKWIGNAIRARYFINENEQYSIKEKDGELAVIPVDYSNTGVTLKNTVWSYGLHQFVQIKHNLRVTPESLTSSCVSNYAYIGKYGNKIFGLTGTLGSKAEQDLLSSVYNVDYARVPTYKTKKFKEPKGVVVPDDDWSFEVTFTSIGLVRSSGRAVLIICKTISDLLALEEQFECLREQLGDCKLKLKKYQDEETAHVTRETVCPGDIIVATNIAGRGADFKTSKELEKNGGLHVCVGFCPDNERVREQAFFRTSRQGNLGSAQLIVRESETKRLGIDTTDLNDIDFDDVKKRIDVIEKERLSDIKFSKVDVLRYEDAVFTLFSDMCQELKNGNVITWGHSYLMKDLKEYWAFWLEDQNFEGKKYSLKEATFVFYKFKNDDKTRRIIGGTISHNPYYGVLQADFFLKNDEVDKAKASLINAICLSKNTKVMYPGFVTLVDSTLEERGPLLPKFRSFLSKVFLGSPAQEDKSNGGYINEVLEYLMITHSGLTEEIDFMEKNFFDDEHNDDFKRVLVKPGKGRVNLLVKHLAAKLTSLKLYRSNVEILLEALEGGDTQNLAVCKRITDYLKNFSPNTKEERQTRDLITDAELTELGAKGMKTVYGLKKISSIPESNVDKAKSQLLGALSLIARASAFPPLTFAVANVASAMIAEAIALVVLSLYKETNNIDDQVQKAEYLKGKSLNYVVSLVVSGTVNLDVCLKIFLRMIRCYRESYFILEHSIDNLKLIKSVNSTQIAKDVKAVEEYSQYSASGYQRKIRVPEALAKYFFDSNISTTVIAQLVDFVVDKTSNGLKNGNGNHIEEKNNNPENVNFFNAAKDSQSVSHIETYLTTISPKKLGGSDENVRNEFSKNNSYVTVCSLPSEKCFKDTPYEKIEKSLFPAVAMLERDYRALQMLRSNTGDGGKKDQKKNTDLYCKEQKELLEKGEFWKVLKNEITEILAISKFYQVYDREYANYTTPIVQMLQYCKNADVPGIPEVAASVSKNHLISQEQYDIIMKNFKLKS